jgi:hypothetical protein
MPTGAGAARLIAELFHLIGGPCSRLSDSWGGQVAVFENLLQGFLGGRLREENVSGVLLAMRSDDVE